VDPQPAPRQTEARVGEAQEEVAKQDDEGQGFKNVICVDATSPHHLL
jgi:hypothetical protein